LTANRQVTRGCTISAGPRTSSSPLRTPLTGNGLLGKPWEGINPVHVVEVLRPGASTVELPALLKRISRRFG
jgi:hypothetical protein